MTMASTLKLVGIVSTLLLVCHSVLSIKCRKCFPPMPEDDCKRSDEVIDCREFEPLGYDSCIQVEYTGNNTIARTCYRSFQCEGARTWCKRRGPCTVTCCQDELCNSSNTMRISTMLLPIPVLVTMAAMVL